MHRCTFSDADNCARKTHYTNLHHARNDKRAMTIHYSQPFGITTCHCCGRFVIFTVDRLANRRRRRHGRALLVPVRRWSWRDALAEAVAA